MKTIGFDLTFISSENLVGSAKFIQRLIKEILKRPLEFKCIFYIQKQIPLSLFDIPESNSNIEVVRVPELSGRYKRILFQQTLFYKYLKKSDVLYGFCTYLPLFARSKKIITLHDMLPFAFNKKHSFLRRLFIIDFTKFISNRVAHIITVSQYSKEDIKKYLGKRDSEITVISNFICSDEKVIQRHSSGDKGLINTRDGIIKLQKPYFCTVSSLQPGKNLSSLIKSFVIFHGKHSHFHLYICGKKGWGYKELFDLVEANNAQDYIHFTGYVEDEELDKIYTDSVGVVYVSYFEGFGIPPLEGFYHGKACVASNVTSLPEVVGEAGVLVNPYDVDSIARGLEEYIKNPEKFDNAISIQRERFSPEIETKKFINILKDIAG